MDLEHQTLEESSDCCDIVELDLDNRLVSQLLSGLADYGSRDKHTVIIGINVNDDLV